MDGWMNKQTNNLLKFRVTRENGTQILKLVSDVDIWLEWCVMRYQNIPLFFTFGMAVK